jgi:2'-5' RNA ligase
VTDESKSSRSNSESVRAFVAVNVPPPIRSAIVETVAPLKDASLPIRWVRPEGIHVTLKFLGEVEEAREVEIVDALITACGNTRSFVLPIAGFGAFPNPRRPRVVWVGCQPVPALELLQNAIECGLEPLGYEPEGRPFRPHLTLGRVRGRPTPFTGFAEQLDQLAYRTEFPVQSIDLMESRLGREGARYTLRHAVALRPS